MKKHTNIPAEATWNTEDNQWELGQRNEQGKEIGIWEAWHVEGYCCGTTDYGNGTPPFLFKRFHPDGTVAQEGNWYGGNKWLGTYRWIKSEHPTTEPFPAGPAEKNPTVWIAEFDYIEEGIYNAQRYFDKQKQAINEAGEVLPVRPANVPERAHYLNKRSSTPGAACWIMGQVDTRIGKYTGDYAEWDLNGAVIVKRVYSLDNGEVIETHEYANGKLKSSNVYKPGELLQSFYHRDTDPAVVSESVLYRNDQTDRLQTFYDLEGRELYSIRLEEVNDHGKRRYYNGILVFEGIGNPDHAKPPSGVQYFYPGGGTMIDYTSNGDGTGVWRLYDEAGLELGTLPVDDEEDKNKYNRWDTFMPSWSSYENKTTRTDWDAIIENFKEIHKDLITRKKANALVAPEHLKQELEKVDWKNIETAMGGGKELPMAITGLLTEDEDVVAMCLDLIWYNIEHQGSVYESTYKVAIVLTRMLPYYATVETVQTRLVKFLFGVVRRSAIYGYKELYQELVTSLNAVAPLMFKWATGSQVLALQSQYLLLHGGRNMEETETVLTQEWHNVQKSGFQRAYAVFCLGYLFLHKRQPEKLIAAFSPAFSVETDKLVRLVMAVLLIAATQKEAQDPWLLELISVLTDPDSIDNNFYELQPFVGGQDVQEYVLEILGYASQEVLESNMDGVIDMLPNAGSLKQVTLFQTIFTVLFPDKAALNDLNPIRKKALLAAAAVIDAHPNFVNHSEVFRDYKVPYDSYTLRQLAAGS